MKGKICVVTGGTSGIGRAVAQELGKRGARVILVGRNSTRGKKIAERINSYGSEGSGEFLRYDLSSQTQIRQLAKSIQCTMPRVDVLINNAGAKFDIFNLSEDGIEMTFALNHLNYFLLTALLLGSLLKAPRARIINVAGESHRFATGDFHPYPGNGRYDRRLAAQQSKLANLLFTYELAERLKDTSVTVNALHPGGVATRIGLNNSIFAWMRHIGAHLLHRNLISARKGADTAVWLAESPEVFGISGKYYYLRKPIDSSPESKNRESAKSLWDLSVRLTKLSANPYFGNL